MDKGDGTVLFAKGFTKLKEGLKGEEHKDMIETARYEDVTQIRMSREMGGVPVYWVSSYLVDGLLIDTGAAIRQTS